MPKRRENNVTTNDFAKIISKRSGIDEKLIREIYKMSAKMVCDAILEGQEVSFYGLGMIYTAKKCWFNPHTRKREIIKVVRMRGSEVLKASVYALNKKDAPAGASESGDDDANVSD